jgi:hypothetical protein
VRRLRTRLRVAALSAMVLVQACVSPGGYDAAASLQLDTGKIIRNGRGYIAVVGNADAVPDCFDVVAGNGSIAAQLDQAVTESASNVADSHTRPAAWRLELRHDRNRRIQGGDYFVTEEGYVGVSSAPFHFEGGAQTFLNCPDADLDWRVYRVVGLEALRAAAP